MSQTPEVAVNVIANAKSTALRPAVR